MTLASNIIEIDQSFVLIDGSETDNETFFETVENYVLQRILAQEKQESNERDQSPADIAVETKVINVNKTSKQNNQQQLFCWGTFVSDSGNIEKRTFVN